MKTNKPKLTLVGAGPGDPELLTLKGLKAFRAADVILYDALVSMKLLDLIPTETPRYYVGKRKGKHSLTQEELNGLIVSLAFQFGHVVRLKGGDPFVFGRGFEEILDARSHGIETEYIPGISSAISIPGLEGIPVTHRGISESFWVITGTNSSRELSDDLKAAMQTKATIVILMGVGHLEKIASLYFKVGKKDMPIAIIQNGATPEKKLVAGTMENILQHAAEQLIESPAVIIIGETVKLHPQFLLQQLESLTILVHR